MGYREPAMYDKLLASLGSSTKVVADMNRRRQREEQGKSATEGDEDQSTTNGEHDEIQGADQESLGVLTKNTEQENNGNHSEEEESEDFETDEKQEFRTNDQSASVDASSSTCAFSEHLSHKLSNEEVETLPKGNCKFKWEAPAINMPNCRWKGTRQNFLHSDATSGLKPKLVDHWLQLHEKSGGKVFDSSQRRRFFSICNSYLDILHSNKTPFYKGGRGEDSSHMDAYLMHSLNHIFRSRDLIKKNDRKIAKSLSDDRFEDRGYTSPKVDVENRVRFNDEFGCEDESDDDDGKPSKPCDWQALFGKGYNDAFMIGIQHTRKNIRLYGDFYSSDMIIASPVKLLSIIGNAEENNPPLRFWLSIMRT